MVLENREISHCQQLLWREGRSGRRGRGSLQTARDEATASLDEPWYSAKLVPKTSKKSPEAVMLHSVGIHIFEDDVLRASGFLCQRIYVIDT